jgi:signal transduction histidine kinase
VKVEDQTLFVELRVEDQGPGIPADIEKRMFEPYFQGPADSQSAGLLGLGLTIAKEVVEAHEGAIEYYRAEPRGSVFRILLPAAPRRREVYVP